MLSPYEFSNIENDGVCVLIYSSYSGLKIRTADIILFHIAANNFIHCIAII